MQTPGHEPPVLAIGTGLWAAVREVFPDTRTALLVSRPGQRAQRPTQVGAARRQGRPGRDLSCRGPRARSRRGKAFAADYGSTWPKAVAKITDNLDVLLELYHPAEHWVHLRTTNPIKLTSATRDCANV